MPDDYYVSKYSGEEIDALLGGAGAGNVRYDAAQTLTDAQKTQARANIAAAQSGFGFGGESIIIIQASGASESHEDYCKKLDAVLNTMANKSIRIIIALPPQLIGYGFFPCMLYKGDMNYASLQSIGGYDYHISGFVIRKAKKYDADPEGTWNPFEWVNPPMQIGVEYRTTERYLGNPVYVKVVNCGQISNGKEIEHGISNMDTCIMAQGLMSAMALPRVLIHDLSNEWSAYISQVYATKIRFECGTSVVGNNIYVILKYTKTTG